jgi:hypothetical protein
MTCIFIPAYLTENPMTYALSEMLRGQLELTENFLNSQKKLYTAFVSSLNSAALQQQQQELILQQQQDLKQKQQQEFKQNQQELKQKDRNKEEKKHNKDERKEDRFIKKSNQEKPHKVI